MPIRNGCVVSCFALALAASLANSQVSPQPTLPSTNVSAASMPTAMPMPIVAPLFIEDDNVHSDITLVSTLLQPVTGTLTLRNLRGDVLLTRKLTFTSHEKKVFSLRSLLDAATTFSSVGSITIEQDPKLTSMALLAQLSMTSYSSVTPTYAEEEFAMPTMKGSQVLRGVTSDTHQPPSVAVTSLSDKPQTISTTCIHAGAVHNINRLLRARATLLLHTCRPTLAIAEDDALRVDSSQSADSAQTYGIEVRSTGMSGTFAAFGIGRSKDELYGIDFSDPASLHSSNTVYAGLPIERSELLPDAKYKPYASLANFTSSVQTVSVLYAPTTELNEPTMETLESITLAPMSTTTATLKIPRVAGDLTNSFIFKASGEPGAVQTKLYAFDDDSLKRVDLLGKDEDSGRNGGDHPWSTENGDRSTFLIFNYTASEQTVQVRIAGKTSEWTNLYKLEPYETKQIVINDIIQKQIADINHTHLAKTEMSGDIQWFTNDSNRATGRLLVSNPRTSLARSFSCYNTYGMCDSFFSPNNYDNLLVGNDASLQSITAYECSSTTGSTCGGQHAGYNYAYVTSWGLTANGAVSTNSSAQSSISLHGISPGTFTVNPYLTAGSCTSNPGPGGGTVGKLTCTPVTRGQVTTCSAVVPAGGSITNWSFTDGTSTVTASSGTTATTWAGVAVTSGTVSVQYTASKGSPAFLTAQLLVTPRSTFASFPAVSPTRRANGYQQPGGSVMNVPNPPSPNVEVGLSQLNLKASLAGQQVVGGPNSGYTYTTSATDQTLYDWVMSQDADNAASVFYQRQCGNYSATSNIHGFISGATLDADTQRHEAGAVQSHYSNYKAALATPANNAGVQAEAVIAAPGGSYQTAVTTALNTADTPVANATHMEPCNSSVVTYNSSCVFDGNINFSPYMACQ